MPTTDQITDAVVAAAQIPINNGLIVIALVTLSILVLGGVLTWRFAPILINLFKQQAETNSQLTKIVGQNTEQSKQNAEQARLAMLSVDNNTTEMRKQTGAIEKLGADFRGYQSTASDAIEEFRADVDKQHEATKQDITEIKASIEQLTKQIEELLKGSADCLGFKRELTEMEKRLMEALKQPVNAVASTTVIIDDVKPPAEPLEGAA